MKYSNRMGCTALMQDALAVLILFSASAAQAQGVPEPTAPAAPGSNSTVTRSHVSIAPLVHSSRSGVGTSIDGYYDRINGTNNGLRLTGTGTAHVNGDVSYELDATARLGLTDIKSNLPILRGSTLQYGLTASTDDDGIVRRQLVGAEVERVNDMTDNIQAVRIVTGNLDSIEAANSGRYGGVQVSLNAIALDDTLECNSRHERGRVAGEDNSIFSPDARAYRSGRTDCGLNLQAAFGGPRNITVFGFRQSTTFDGDRNTIWGAGIRYRPNYRDLVPTRYVDSAH